MTTIRTSRQLIGFSQRDFADALGTSRGAVVQWEAGKRKPTPETEARIADVVQFAKEQPAKDDEWLRSQA